MQCSTLRRHTATLSVSDLTPLVEWRQEGRLAYRKLVSVISNGSFPGQVKYEGRGGTG